MSTVIRIGAILALAIFSVSAQADIIGKPRIIDGDTIEIAGDTGSSGDTIRNLSGPRIGASRRPG